MAVHIDHFKQVASCIRVSFMQIEKLMLVKNDAGEFAIAVPLEERAESIASPETIRKPSPFNTLV